jgi:hypothetical protein
VSRFCQRRSQDRPDNRQLAHALAERVGIDEVRERSLAVDLDDGKVLAVTRLEHRVAVDLHHVELEAELRLRLTDDLERRPTEPAALGAVDDDPRYG